MSEAEPPRKKLCLSLKERRKKLSDSLGDQIGNPFEVEAQKTAEPLHKTKPRDSLRTTEGALSKFCFNSSPEVNKYKERIVPKSTEGQLSGL